MTTLHVHQTAATQQTERHGGAANGGSRGPGRLQNDIKMINVTHNHEQRHTRMFSAQLSLHMKRAKAATEQLPLPCLSAGHSLSEVQTTIQCIRENNSPVRRGAISPQNAPETVWRPGSTDTASNTALSP